MTLRKALVVLAAVAVAVALLRRRREATAARIDVYYEDGSMISLERGTPQADRMLSLAADALAASRPA
jgi:hypothetical protein